MKRELYDELAEVPGAILKPKSKRDKSEGRQQGNSSLRTYSTLKTRAPLKAVNAERREERHAEAFGIQAQACRDICICCCCGKEGVTEPHHYISRGAGGTDRHCIPMLREHHQKAHAIGAQRFWMEVGLDPADIAEGMATWVAAGCPRGYRPW